MKPLKTVALTSSGRVEILNVIKEDLNFMEEFSTVTVEVFVVSTDRIEILVKIQEPDNLESNEFTYIWDSTKAELTGLSSDNGITSGNGVALNNILNFEL